MARHPQVFYDLAEAHLAWKTEQIAAIHEHGSDADLEPIDDRHRDGYHAAYIAALNEFKANDAYLDHKPITIKGVRLTWDAGAWGMRAGPKSEEKVWLRRPGINIELTMAGKRRVGAEKAGAQ